MKKRLTALLCALGTALPALLAQGTASSDALNLIPKRSEEHTSELQSPR